MGIKPIMVVSFSGGRTSAFMAKWLLDNMSHLYIFYFVFANTGLEHEETLIFVDRCDREWGLNLVWIESISHPEFGKGQTFKIVDFKTAARNGEPFESLIKVEGISSPGTPRCSHRLKGIPLDKYRRAISCDAVAAIGIRVDEIDRMNANAKKLKLVYPLISMRPTTKAEIIHWFKKRSFDLELPEHLGNCVTCWKKSDRKLFTIAKHTPEAFDFFARMEKEHSLTKAIDGERRYWFRKHRTVFDIIERAKQPFFEFVEYDPEYQLDLFDLDKVSGCEESCEAFAA